jgi:hypothetical protein
MIGAGLGLYEITARLGAGGMGKSTARPIPGSSARHGELGTLFLCPLSDPRRVEES